MLALVTFVMLAFVIFVVLLFWYASTFGTVVVIPLVVFAAVPLVTSVTRMFMTLCGASVRDFRELFIDSRDGYTRGFRDVSVRDLRDGCASRSRLS